MANNQTRRRTTLSRQTRAYSGLSLWPAIYLVALHEKLYLQPYGTAPISVDGWCVMMSPIVEYGRSGDITNIIALSRVQGNPGWTDHPQNLVENARRFEKEILRPGGDANI